MDKIFSLIIILFLISCNEAVDIKKELQTFTLQNDYLKVIAKKNGAELISIKLLEDRPCNCSISNHWKFEKRCLSIQ